MVKDDLGIIEIEIKIEIYIYIYIYIYLLEPKRGI